MKQKLQIVADEAIPFLRGVLEPYAEIHYLPGEQISNQNIKQADALLVRTRTNCNLSLLQNTAVQMVATATIGMDHLDTDFLRKAGIHFTNAPDFTRSKSFSAARIQLVISGKSYPRSIQARSASRSFSVYTKNSV